MTRRTKRSNCLVPRHNLERRQSARDFSGAAKHFECSRQCMLAAVYSGQEVLRSRDDERLVQDCFQSTVLFRSFPAHTVLAMLGLYQFVNNVAPGACCQRRVGLAKMSPGDVETCGLDFHIRDELSWRSSARSALLSRLRCVDTLFHGTVVAGDDAGQHSIPIQWISSNQLDFLQREEQFLERLLSPDAQGRLAHARQ